MDSPYTQPIQMLRSHAEVTYGWDFSQPQFKETGSSIISTAMILREWIKRIV